MNDFVELKKSVDEEYSIANVARKSGLDPVDRVEIPLATSLAEKRLLSLQAD